MKKTTIFVLMCVLLLGNTLNVFADQIVLKNGDRITGKILKKDGDKIVIETESAGTITILWAAVERVASDEPLNLELTDGQLIKEQLRRSRTRLRWKPLMRKGRR